MKQSAKRFISSIVSLLLLVAAFVVFFNFVQPAYREVAALKGKLLSLQTSGAEQAAVFKSIQALNQTYNESQEAREAVSLALPLTPALAEALAQVNGLVINNNLSAQSYIISAVSEPVLSEEARRSSGISGGDSITIQPAIPISFSLRLTGSYGDFKNFLKQLETNVRIFDVKTLSVQKASQSDQDFYLYDLTVTTYYQYQQ
jgi:Tfp pilus assembly protein PilO